ncbi:MAG: DUF1080 domain-containing protein [Sulfurovum sp.]|nr:DUF1080 domain-containing protein [Sulfurovum sp.]
MKKIEFKRRNIIMMIMASVVSAALCCTTLQAKEKVWHFDDIPTGKLPIGWKVDATNPGGDLASWQVVRDKSAPSSSQVLALTSINHNNAAAFNLCWTDSISFLDGEIEVKFKASTGSVDQGGGVIWRVLDAENYYIARFNPLEDNFRLYSVKNGTRRELAGASVSLPAGEWHTLKIVQKGDRYAGYLNGKKYLEGRDDTFLKRGGAGLWSKADAVTSFDDFSVKTK